MTYRLTTIHPLQTTTTTGDTRTISSTVTKVRSAKN